MLLFKKQRILQNNRCEADIAIKMKNKTCYFIKDNENK